MKMRDEDSKGLAVLIVLMLLAGLLAYTSRLSEQKRSVPIQLIAKLYATPQGSSSLSCPIDTTTANGWFSSMLTQGSGF